MHTVLRLPTGVFARGGVKVNVIFFDAVRPMRMAPQRRVSCGFMISGAVCISPPRRIRWSVPISMTSWSAMSPESPGPNEVRPSIQGGNL